MKNFITLPKERIFTRKKLKSGTFSLPLELKSLSSEIYRDLTDYIQKALNQRERKEKQIIKSITIQHIAFAYTTIKEAVEELFKAISKNKQMSFIGHLNDIFLFLEKAIYNAPNEIKK